MGWWRSLYLRNALGIHDETLQLVAQYVQCAQGDFPERMMRYAIDGDDKAVLAEIVETRNEDYQNFWATYSGIQQASVAAIQLLPEQSHESGNRLFSDIQTLPPLLSYRLAKLNEALSSYVLLPLGWLHQLLARLSPYGLFAHFDVADATSLSISADYIEQLLQASDEPSTTLAKVVFLADANDFHNDRLIAGTCAALQGFNQYCLQQTDTIREALQQKQTDRRNFVLEILTCRQIPIEPYLDLVVKQAFSSRKGERELAARYLMQYPAQVTPWLEASAIDSKPAERERAIQLLWTIQGAAARPFLEQRHQQESAEKVRQAITIILEVETLPVADLKAVDLPVIPPISAEAPLPEVVRAKVMDFIQHRNAFYKRMDADAFIHCLKDGSAKDCIKYTDTLHPGRTHCDSVQAKLLYPILKEPQLNFLHLFRLLILSGHFRRSFHNRDLGSDFFELLNHYHRMHPHTGLRELAAAWEVLGLNPDEMGRALLAYDARWTWQGIWWEDSVTWPYFYERPHLLEEALNAIPGDLYASEKKHNAFRILKQFPQPPAALIPLLWTIALGTAKTERPTAQKLLNCLPNITAQLLETLQQKDVKLRTIAAEWLADRQDTVAIKPLQTLLRKESSDTTKVALMRALERLGASIDEFLDRDSLLADAQKGLKKGIPEALNWFPWADLPSVHWNDNNQAVEPTILTWLVVQSYKQKSPEPSPILQHYAQLWNEGDRLALGDFVLSQWIAQDTALYTQEEAELLARKNIQIYGQYLPPNKTQEQFYQEHLNHLLTQLRGSATKEKGILAITAACITGTSAVLIVKKYLDTWYGNRAAQCNALLQMLSWIEDNAAIQYLLSIASRFRTKSIQKEADKLIQAIADRHQWTPEELGDHTIPTAGLGSDRTLTLDYGSRQFTLTLDQRLNPILKTAEGKVLKALPNANQQDNPDLVEAAKAAFSHTKKELKQVLQIQKTRLYEAMTVQRSWAYSDWESLLNQHPIISLYTQALVWAVFEDDRFIYAIRPLGDGTLTTLDDCEVTLKPDTVLRLAHAFLVSETDAQAWNAHLSDYEVVPPFVQFWTGLYSIPADPQITDLNDFHNHTLEAFHLRGRATKRGYNRGPTGDGGYFGTYHKTFASVGIESVIDFSGNSLPEENIPVQLYGLYFYKPDDRRIREIYDLNDHAKLPLQSVPPVLLQECWNDLRHIISP